MASCFNPGVSNQRTGRGTGRRRGSALVLVLGLVAITLAVSYAMMRTQSTSVQIGKNQNIQGDARQAALTGMRIGLRRMHESDWQGPSGAFYGWLSSSEAYIVWYNLGDASLSEDDPDWEDYPYRVTVHSQGYAVDPENVGIISLHTIEVVVRLNPTELGSQPGKWETMQQYTLYQTHNDTFEMNIPYRIEGPVRAQGQLRIAKNYPDDNDARKRYFSDLGLMNLVEGDDYRPFTGPVYWDISDQTYNDYYDLTARLGVTTVHTESEAIGSDWIQPTSVTTYQLYPNGPTYSVQTLSGTLTGVSLGPDPLTNPLGIFYCDDSLTLGDNVTIRGSLICKRDVEISGTNVTLLPVEMTAPISLGGTLRLPVVCCEDFTVTSSAGGSLTGLLAVFDDFEVQEGPASVAFAITGRVIAKEVKIRNRQPWNYLDWSFSHWRFLMQYALGQKYFPNWLYYGYGYNPDGKIRIVPDSDTVTYDWFTYNGSEPVYVLDSGIDGLHWDVIRWTDDP